jgi:hypothetical protein
MMNHPTPAPDGKVNAGGVSPGCDGSYVPSARRDPALSQDRP